MQKSLSQLQRILFSALFSAALFLLTGCGQKTPAKDTAGNSWSESWTRVGNVLGIEAVPDGFSLLENKDVLAPQGLWYATWTAGNSRPYTNDENKEVELYDAQLYLLVNEQDQEEDAEGALQEWLSAARTNYEIEKDSEIAAGDLPCRILTYRCNPEKSPYERGASAFFRTAENAVCVELTCMKDTGYDPEALLTEFLGGMHFAAS